MKSPPPICTAALVETIYSSTPIVQMLHRPRPTRAAIGDGGEGLADPFLVCLIQGIFKHAGDRVVVLGDDVDEAVEPADCLLPPYRLGVLTWHPQVGRDFIEEGQRVIAQIDDLDLQVIARLGLLGHPLGGGVRVAGRPGRADDDGDTGLSAHGNVLYAGFQT